VNPIATADSITVVAVGISISSIYPTRAFARSTPKRRE
jgi:hypothetical protein